MSEQKPKWNFDVTRISADDLDTCIFHAQHGRMPSAAEQSDEPIDLALFEGGGELARIELAALYAHGVLASPRDPLFGTNGFGCAGELPDSVDPDRYEGMQAHSSGGINLDETYHDYRLAELAPILIKYPFTA